MEDAADRDLLDLVLRQPELARQEHRELRHVEAVARHVALRPRPVGEIQELIQRLALQPLGQFSHDRRKEIGVQAARLRELVQVSLLGCLAKSSESRVHCPRAEAGHVRQV